ncbi:MAG: 50S ribosomal protein L21 [Patescibacteria group bacterium]
MKYAIINLQGKQVKVYEGETILSDLVEHEVGTSFKADSVLLVSDDEKTTVGQPHLDSVSVSLEVISHGQSPKIRVATYTAKSRHRKVHGHRQDQSTLKVVSISSK